jgi:hypothetical protein
MFDWIIVLTIVLTSLMVVVYVPRIVERSTRLGYQMGKREDVGLPDVRESPREFDMIDQREDERTQPAPQEDEDMEDEDL